MTDAEPGREELLWIAVLELAIKDFNRYASIKPDDVRTMQKCYKKIVEIINWFRSKNTDVCSFLWIASFLRRDPRYFLERIETDLQKLETYLELARSTPPPRIKRRRKKKVKAKQKK